MAVIALAPKALADLERLRTFLLETVASAAEQTVDLILSGIAVIEHHPLIGRPVEAALRELVISRGKSGYVALYRYDEIRDRALVLTIRHQRETGMLDRFIGISLDFFELTAKPAGGTAYYKIGICICF